MTLSSNRRNVYRGRCILAGLPEPATALLLLHTLELEQERPGALRRVELLRPLAVATRTDRKLVVAGELVDAFDYLVVLVLDRQFSRLLCRVESDCRDIVLVVQRGQLRTLKPPHLAFQLVSGDGLPVACAGN